MEDSKTQHGFTLLELMITLFIVSILLAVAVPSFKEMSVRSRLVTYTNDFIATVNIARSEAVRRGSPVTICHSNNGTSCGGSWNTGWIVFSDVDNNGTAGNAAVEPVLRVHEALDKRYTIGADAAIASRVTFGADGSANASGVLALCHDDKTDGARAVVLTRLRPRAARDTDGDRIPETDFGNIESCSAPSGA